MINIICPVPQDQRPLNEFNSIKDSWIISWPFLEKKLFYRKLIYSYIIFLPIILTISYGSNFLRDNLFDYILVSATSSLSLPIFLLLRQFLSLRYIFIRLNSEKIEYEESGWYDGQVWEKPIEWRAKDLLIAQHQIKPVLKHIKNVLTFIISIIFCSLSFILFNINLK